MVTARGEGRACSGAAAREAAAPRRLPSGSPGAGQRKGLSTHTAWQTRRSRARRLSVSPQKRRNHWPPPAPHTPETGWQAGTPLPHHCRPKLTSECWAPGQGGCPEAPGGPAQLTREASGKSALSLEGEWQALWPSGGHGPTPRSWPPAALCQSPGAISEDSGAPEQGSWVVHPGPLPSPALPPASLRLPPGPAPPCWSHRPRLLIPAERTLPQPLLQHPTSWSLRLRGRSPWASIPSECAGSRSWFGTLSSGPLCPRFPDLGSGVGPGLSQPHTAVTVPPPPSSGLPPSQGPSSISYLAGHGPGPPRAVCLLRLTVWETPTGWPRVHLCPSSRAPGPASSLVTQAGTLAAVGFSPQPPAPSLGGAAAREGPNHPLNPSSCLRVCCWLRSAGQLVSCGARGNKVSRPRPTHPPPGSRPTLPAAEGPERARA